MAKKYYAVRKGKQPGIYLTWNDCRDQVVGYSGAVYKSFASREEAENFLGTSSQGQSMDEFLTGSSQGSENTACEAEIIAYIDGSYDKRTGAVGSGGIIFYQNQEIPFSFGTKEPQYAEFWNVSGELLAAMYVMRFALEKGVTSCALYYDYMGIEMWATGAWKRNNTLTKSYAAFAQNIMKSVALQFYKVAAHTGNTYNEMADQLAKKGAKEA